MAIIKHVSVKNADYRSAVKYLTEEHDERTGKPILDEKGRPIMRREFLIDGLLCNPETFAEECEEANRRFDIRWSRNSVKTHHYIISFDPRDRDDHRLTPEIAQDMGMAFAKKHFPGHQVIVCTHPDGHHSSGNIHVHIVLNSLRITDVPELPYMTQNSDHTAGGHHRATTTFMKYLKEDLMEMCQERGLYQMDLTTPAAIHVTDQEYQEMSSPTVNTQEMQKSILRNAITHAALTSGTYEEFRDYLYIGNGISIKESRGAISYRCPDSEQWIRGKSLGTAFEKKHIIKAIGNGESILKDAYHGQTYQTIMANVYDSLEQNRLALENKSKSDILSAPSKFERMLTYDPARLRLITDPEGLAKAQNNPFYANKVTAGNINQMSRTITYLKQNHISSIAELDQQISNLTASHAEFEETYYATKERLDTVNQKIHFLGQATTNASIYKTWIAIADDTRHAQYRQEHKEEIAAYEEARRHLKELFGAEKWPSLKELKAEKQELMGEKNEAYYRMKEGQRNVKELEIVKTNIDTILSERGQLPRVNSPER